MRPVTETMVAAHLAPRLERVGLLDALHLGKRQNDTLPHQAAGREHGGPALPGDEIDNGESNGFLVAIGAGECAA